MRLNDDGRTVAAMDLIPEVSDLLVEVGKEDRLDVLEQRMAKLGVAAEGKVVRRPEALRKCAARWIWVRL